MSYPARGALYAGVIDGDKAAMLVVSRAGRNRLFNTVIVVEVQLGQKIEGFPSAVALGDGDPVDGVVLADYMWTIETKIVENLDLLGNVSPNTMLAIDAAIAVALDIG